MIAKDLTLMGEVIEERQRQRDQWNQQHDREHTGAEWAALLTIYVGKVAASEFGRGPKEYRRRLIQVAAVAMAAIEAEDSREGPLR